MLKLFYLVISFLMLNQAQARELVLDDNPVHEISTPMLSLQVKSADPLNRRQRKQFSFDHYDDSIKPSKHGSWHKITLNSNFSSDQPQRRTLVVNSHIIRHLHFYLYDQGTLIKYEELGNADENNIIRDSDISEYQSPYFQFYMQNNNPLTLLIYKQNDGPAILPMAIYTDEGLKKNERKIQFFWGGIICVLLVMGLYNIIVHAMHPTKAYLWYMSLHCILIFYFAGLHGYGYLIFPIDLQIWLSQNIMPLNFLLILTVLNFASSFLDLKHNAPQFYKFVKPLNIACIVGFAASFIVPEYHLIPIFSLLQFLGTLFGISAALSAYINNYKPAKYFLLSWVFTLVGGAVGMGTVLGTIPANFFTLHAFLFGTIAELFLFSVALAHRMKVTEQNMLSQSYTYPGTKIGNFSFLNNKLPQQIPSMINNNKLMFIVSEVHGLKELVSLYGPESLFRYYGEQTDLLSKYLSNQEWSVSCTLPSSETVNIIALPGEKLFLMASIGLDLSSEDQKLKEHEILTAFNTMFNNISSKTEKNVKTSLVSGYSFFHQDDVFSNVFRQAQVALLSAAKNNESWIRYSSEQDTEISQRINLIKDIDLAIRKDQLQLYIQPQFLLNTNELCGGEILLRWNHPETGFIRPDLFIPLAEQSGQVFLITKLVINNTFKWLSELKQNHPEFYQKFEVSINLSALDMAQDQLISHLQSGIFLHNIDSHRITLEVTESAVLNNEVLFLDTIRKLKLLGFRISIDDFGTGYSSMQYLQTIKAHEIKIDMAFIRDIDTNITSQNITKAIIQLAHSTDAITVAEGIQSDEEMLCLKSMNCSKAQGFYWSPAIPLTQFVDEHIKQIYKQ